MYAIFQSAWPTLRRWLPSALVFGALAAIGYAGYVTDWAVPGLSGRDAAPTPRGEETAIQLVPASSESFDHLEIRFPNEETAARRGLQHAPVVTRTLTESITAYGMVDYSPTRIAHLSVPVTGVAWHVEKHLGDEVKKGDVLALVAAPEVGRAKADFKNALLLTRTRQRRRDMLNPSTTAPATLIEADTQLREARIQLINAQQTLLNWGLPLRLEELEPLTPAEIHQRLRTLGLPATAMHRLDEQTAVNNLLPLVAPFDGTVVGRDIVHGELVGPDRPIPFTIADLRRLDIHLDLRQEDMARVRLEQPAVFQPDGTREEPVVGAVHWISTAVEQKTRTLPVHVTVENSQGRLRVHQYGTGRISVRTVPQAVAVPNGAIQRPPGGPLVFVFLSPTRVQARRVQLGLHGDGYTQVLAGVTPGEKVVTSGSEALLVEMLRGQAESPGEQRAFAP